MTNPDIRNIELQKAFFERTLARLDALNRPDARVYVDALRNEAKEGHAQTAKALQRAKDASIGTAENDRRRREAEAAKAAAESAISSMLYGGTIDAAELLKNRDAIYVAGMTIDACGVIGARLISASSGAASNGRATKLRQRLEQAEKQTRGILETARSISPQQADSLASTQAHACRSDSDVALLLVDEAAVLDENDAANEERKHDRTFVARAVSRETLEAIFKRRHAQACMQAARNGGEQKMAAQIAELRSLVAATAAPAPTEGTRIPLTPEQKGEFPEVSALEKKRAKKPAPGPEAA